MQPALMPPSQTGLQAQRVRLMLWQAVAFGLVGIGVFLLWRITGQNLQARGIASGFDFLGAVARVPVANASLPFETGQDSYGRALLIGVVNTLKISVAAVVLATVLGVLIGSGRLSENPLVRTVCASYVEVMRNVPVLLHIFIWYQIAINLPGLSDAYNPFGLFIASNRGIFLPSLHWELGQWLPSFHVPKVDGFDVAGGVGMSPEYAALLIGISTYSASFIAEIVRGAILAIPHGQWEAGGSIGLTRGMVFRKVVLPQAARLSMPPVTSEYLGILKNSSLAVAVGYQDVVAIGNSTLFETGQAIEVVGLIMLFYVVVSLIVSGLMELVQRRFALQER
jgi:general L-amino acid transport system permease protein